MRIPAHHDNALRVMVLLARQPPGTLLPTREAAEMLGLPRRFVEQQVGAMVKAGLVAARRGPNGGCALARTAGEISVADVVGALDGEVLGTPDGKADAVSSLWQAAAASYECVLAEMPLDSLARRQEEIEGASADMYAI